MLDSRKVNTHLLSASILLYIWPIASCDFLRGQLVYVPSVVRLGKCLLWQVENSRPASPRRQVAPHQEWGGKSTQAPLAKENIRPASAIALDSSAQWREMNVWHHHPWLKLNGLEALGSSSHTLTRRAQKRVETWEAGAVTQEVPRARAEEGLKKLLSYTVQISQIRKHWTLKIEHSSYGMYKQIEYTMYSITNSIQKYTFRIDWTFHVVLSFYLCLHSLFVIQSE